MYGAVRLCHRPHSIRSRRARYTYGYSAWCDVEDETDLQQPADFDDDGYQRCERFITLIRVGESVAIGQSVHRSIIPIRRSQSSMVVSLLTSPEYDPRYPSDPGVQRLANIEVNLTESIGQDTLERNAILNVYFGEVIVRAEAYNPRTGRNYEASIRFVSQ